MKNLKVTLAAAAAMIITSASVASAEARSGGSITIKAPIEQVWALVVGVDNWPQWNKAVASAKLKGAVAKGGEFDWKSRGFEIHSTFQDVVPFRHVSWRDEAPCTHAFHSWEFRLAPDGVVVTTVETMTGLVPTVMRGSTQKMLDEVIPSLLKSLKVAAERPEPGR